MTEPHAELLRAAARHRMLKSARIVFNSDSSSFNVTIRDMSDSGVRLRLGAPFVVPHTFDLLISNPNTGTHERRACETRWQRGDQVGAHLVTIIATKDDARVARPSLRRKPVGA